MDYILSIIPLLGMASLFDYIEIHKCDIRNKDVLRIIKESEYEYKQNVDEPYAGMRNCNAKKS